MGAGVGCGGNGGATMGGGGAAAVAKGGAFDASEVEGAMGTAARLAVLIGNNVEGWGSGGSDGGYGVSRQAQCGGESGKRCGSGVAREWDAVEEVVHDRITRSVQHSPP